MTTTGTPWTTRKIAVYGGIAVAVLVALAFGGLALRNAMGVKGTGDERRAADVCRRAVMDRTGITSTTAEFSQVASVKTDSGVFHVSGELADVSVLGTRSRQTFACTVRVWDPDTFIPEIVEIN